MYDKIFVGTSIPMLFFIYFHHKNEDILIINKETKVGGSWHTTTNSYCKDFDTAGHFIVIRNKLNLDRVLKLFNDINVEIGYQNPEILNENYKFIYNSLIFYPIKGWDFLIKQLLDKINYKIMFDTEVKEINVNGIVNIKVLVNNEIKILESNKIFIPSYIKLSKFYLNNSIIKLDFEKCCTYHVIFYCKIEDNNKYNNTYHGFYEGDLIFDRLTCVCNPEKMLHIKTVNQLIICRVSRKFKHKILNFDKEDIHKYFLDFLKIKNIQIDNLFIKNFELVKYDFNYRQNINEILNKINTNNLEIINTTDLGLLIETNLG